ncbi:hypothetical protein CD798_10735 [Bacillaceae bacterium SAOS 7]|nr:hypothetical protein CD798_10735 [Bacillaceae bacterium SAOS 7]
MRQEVMGKINNNKEWLAYLRKEPIWYRLLSRNPYDLEKFERASLHYYKKTFPHQVERVNDGLLLASALFSMMNSQISTPTSSESTNSTES